MYRQRLKKKSESGGYKQSRLDEGKPKIFNSSLRGGVNSITIYDKLYFEILLLIFYYNSITRNKIHHRRFIETFTRFHEPPLVIKRDSHHMILYVLQLYWILNFFSYHCHESLYTYQFILSKFKALNRVRNEKEISWQNEIISKSRYRATNTKTNTFPF